MVDKTESRKPFAKIIAKAWRDPDYKAKLLTDPHAALAEVGVEVPPGTTLKVIENTADTQHLVLPVAPGNAGELSIEELEKVAGGMHKGSYPSS